jgi:hypothetical protein
VLDRDLGVPGVDLDGADLVEVDVAYSVCTRQEPSLPSVDSEPWRVVACRSEPAGTSTVTVAPEPGPSPSTPRPQPRRPPRSAVVETVSWLPESSHRIASASPRMSTTVVSRSEAMILVSPSGRSMRTLTGPGVA